MVVKNKIALILIDIQKGFEDIKYWGDHRNNDNAENNVAKLLDFWRENNEPVFHIKHCSVNPDSKLYEDNPGNEFKEIVQPVKGEIVIKKSVNSAFIGTDLKQQLDNSEIRKLVIVGLTTDHCVSTTTRMAGNYGYDTYLVSDATAAFNKRGMDGTDYSAELVHQVTLASLQKEFATIITTDKLISLLKDEMI